MVGRVQAKRRRAYTGLLAVLVAALCHSSATAQTVALLTSRRLSTFANPVDLPYRYQSIRHTHREAADPTVIWFKDRYWLFASHSKGYWHSNDLLHWTFVEAHGYDVDRFAPTVVAINGRLYLSASERAKKIWVTDDPMSGTWSEAADVGPGFMDPDLFLDDDGRLYMYEGSGGKDDIKVHELEPKTFRILQSALIPQSRGKERRGWEVSGEHNERLAAPSYIEGAWMTKYRGRYYLQYAAPATEFRSYADGVLIADKPMGPFTYQNYSPFSSKPTGFIGGAGHGSTFRSPGGMWWHIATMSISQRFMFERRLGLFPTSFTRRGELIADTYLGDYPRYVDGARELTGWMLLSRGKPVTASSFLPGSDATKAVDEDVRTWWSAATGAKDEWFQIDLQAIKRIDAVQINFADQDSAGKEISHDVYNYTLELSADGKTWRTVVDHASTGRDAPHDYEVMRRPERARYVRLTNVHSPNGSKFSLYDLRVFGKGEGARPSRVSALKLQRDGSDGRKAAISWAPAPNAEFYVVRLGPRRNLLNQNFQVYDGQTSLIVASLNAGVNYCAAIDAVNENGIERGGVRCGR